MILSCSNISKAFGTEEILKHVSFHVEDHEKAAIVGINGAGKSTLLKIIVGELGDTLSGGEKQRIGIARAFLHDASMILLDEPTSNLDSLNEGIILKSLKESAEEKTIVLVSHRVSTMNVADVVYEMENGRIS